MDLVIKCPDFIDLVRQQEELGNEKFLEPQLHQRLLNQCINGARLAMGQKHKTWKFSRLVNTAEKPYYNVVLSVLLAHHFKITVNERKLEKSSLVKLIWEFDLSS
mgnify:CR=1 FL=1